MADFTNNPYTFTPGNVDSSIRYNFFRMVGRKPTDAEVSNLASMYYSNKRNRDENLLQNIQTYASQEQPQIEQRMKLDQDLSNPTSAMNTNPLTKDLPMEVKQGIINDPNNPLNPNNPNNIIETTSPEGALAAGENTLIKNNAGVNADLIKKFGEDYTKDANDFRTRLAERMASKEDELKGLYEGELGKYQNELATSRQKTFEQANPFILEDLNRRGLFNSETAVNQEQANALAKLQAADEAKLGEARLGMFNDLQGYRQQQNDALTSFDNYAFGENADIDAESLNTLTEGNTDALNAALNLRRGKLENSYNLAMSAADRQTARDLAKDARKGSMGRIIASGGKQS